MRESCTFFARAARLPFLLLFALGFNSVSAQTIVAPTNNENTFLSSVSSVGSSLNNAILDYSTGQLMAAVWDDGSGVGTIAIGDGTSSATPYTLRLPSGCSPCNISFPDVALGGDNSGGSTYYAGIIYGVTDQNNITDIYLDVLTITNVGSGPIVTFSCSDPVNISNSIMGVPIGQDDQPHIDIISKKDPNSSLVTSDNFVVSWDQAGDVYGLYYSGLSSIAANCGSFTPPSPVNITNGANPGGVYGFFSDVAGIERLVAPHTIHDFALFTYLDLTTTELHYQEWDVTSSPSPTTIIDTLGKYPRIDAIDCYTENNPTNGYANYDVVYQYDNGTFPIQMRSHNALSGSKNATQFYFNGALPTVACGPGMKYDMAYFSFNGGNQHIYSQILDWSSGNFNPNITTYYQVDKTTTSFGGSTPTAISSAANKLIPDNVFVCWYNYTNSEIDYKITNGSTPLYKAAFTNTLSSNDTWLVSPNPVTQTLYLNTSTKNLQNTTYAISDILGHYLLQGEIVLAKQPIDVKDLAAGTYFVNITEDGSAKTMRFIKQ